MRGGSGAAGASTGEDSVSEVSGSVFHLRTNFGLLSDEQDKFGEIRANTPRQHSQKRSVA